MLRAIANEIDDMIGAVSVLTMPGTDHAPEVYRQMVRTMVGTMVLTSIQLRTVADDLDPRSLKELAEKPDLPADVRAALDNLHEVMALNGM